MQFLNVLRPSCNWFYLCVVYIHCYCIFNVKAVDLQLTVFSFSKCARSFVMTWWLPEFRVETSCHLINLFADYVLVVIEGCWRLLRLCHQPGMFHVKFINWQTSLAANFRTPRTWSSCLDEAIGVTWLITLGVGKINMYISSHVKELRLNQSLNLHTPLFPHSCTNFFINPPSTQ